MLLSLINLKYSFSGYQSISNPKRSISLKIKPSGFSRVYRIAFDVCILEQVQVENPKLIYVYHITSIIVDESLIDKKY